MSRVLLFQVDGKLPNLALMRISAWHRMHGDDVRLVRDLAHLPIGLRYDRAYASSIFQFSAAVRKRLYCLLPELHTGGTGYRTSSSLSEVITDCNPDELPCDYSIYPEFRWSMGYTSRGCEV